jgi:hypothetical protein
LIQAGSLVRDVQAILFQKNDGDGRSTKEQAKLIKIIIFSFYFLLIFIMVKIPQNAGKIFKHFSHFKVLG